MARSLAIRQVSTGQRLISSAHRPHRSAGAALSKIRQPLAMVGQSSFRPPLFLRSRIATFSRILPPVRASGTAELLTTPIQLVAEHFPTVLLIRTPPPALAERCTSRRGH